MLALALVPTLSRALAFAADGGRWVEVCTPQGMKLVPLAGDAGDRADGTPTGAPSLDPCGLCLLSAHGAAPVPAPPALPPAAARGTAAPAACGQSPHPLPPWTRAQPRAPPSHA